jgi:hypothetical protein
VSAFSLRVPLIRALYEQVATPKKLGDLGLAEVLDWTAAALNRVDRAAFFQKFQDEHAVQYFYERKCADLPGSPAFQCQETS